MFRSLPPSPPPSRRSLNVSQSILLCLFNDSPSSSGKATKYEEPTMQHKIETPGIWVENHPPRDSVSEAGECGEYVMRLPNKSQVLLWMLLRNLRVSVVHIVHCLAPAPSYSTSAAALCWLMLLADELLSFYNIMLLPYHVSFLVHLHPSQSEAPRKKCMWNRGTPSQHEFCSPLAATLLCNFLDLLLILLGLLIPCECALLIIIYPQLRSCSW